MQTDKRGAPAFPCPISAWGQTATPAQEGLRMREYYAAHCPITMDEAYEVWAGVGKLRQGGRDTKMSLDLRGGKDRIAFMEWWALMRFEYADAMMKHHRENLED